MLDRSRHPLEGWDVFLSYERAQEALARQLADGLRGAGLRVFFDLDDLGEADRLDRVLEARARAAGAGVVVGRDGWGRSGWAVAEYEILLSRHQAEGMPLVLVFPDGSAPASPPPGPTVVRVFDTAQAVDDILRALQTPVVARHGDDLAERTGPVECMVRAASEGRDAEAASFAREVLAIAATRAEPERLALLRQVIAPLLRVSDDHACEAVLSEAWRLAEALDQPRADLAHDMAIVVGRRGDPAEAAWLDLADQRARLEDDAELAAMVRVQRALGAQRRGDAAATIALLEPLVERWTPGSDPSMAMTVLLMLGSSLRMEGHTAEARRRLEELRFRARARRDRTSESAAVFELGCLVDDTAPDEALALYDESQAISRDAGDLPGLVRALAQAAVHLARRGRSAQARAALDAARAEDPASPLIAWAEAWVHA